MNPRRLAAALVTLLCAAAWLAAGPRDAPPEGIAPGTAAHGRHIYDSLGCGTCHALSRRQEADDGLLRAGHPLEGSAYRGTWWSGRITTDVGEAADYCLRTFVDPATSGFDAAERKALVLFAQGLGRERDVSPMILLRRDAGDVDISSGDAGRGRVLFARACRVCHEADTESLRALAEDRSPRQVADVIRKGRGLMPFFQVDRLEAPQVADIAVYLESVQPVEPR